MRERFPRSAGILLHPTSLPGPWGIGDVGASAYRFVDFLTQAGQSLWQILPLNPTGFGNSPYQSPSAFAGNPLLISLDRLVEDGLLEHEEIYNGAGQPVQSFLVDRVDYDVVEAFKLSMLYRSFKRFQGGSSPRHSNAFSQFCSANADWLEDYALFMAIKEKLGGKALSTWDRDIVTRQPATIERLRNELAERVELRKYMQYMFFSQWTELKAYANKNHIKIVGDAPIFVSDDSSEVWANMHLFSMDETGKPTVVAGVPPDFFSATGQRWGNPLYRWDRMAEQGYDWWIRRIKATLMAVDILRLDHFRGFADYWEIPASEPTAIHGRWVPGPGADFFQKIGDALGDLPIIAEDLGIITREVEELRDQFHLPGMKVLQFAFGDTSKNPYLPHNYTNPNAVVYTGTHDNDTTLGWFRSINTKEREKLLRYLGRDGHDIAWDLMQIAYGSVADMVVVPLQDILRLGTEARQNRPGIVGGNWAWRFHAEDLTPELAQGLRQFTATYGRLPESAGTQW